MRIQLDPNNVPPGSLVSFVQKGLQYTEMESNIDAVRLFVKFVFALTLHHIGLYL